MGRIIGRTRRDDHRGSFPWINPGWPAVLAVGVALGLLGCGPGHSRPHGQTDTSYAIAPSGESVVFNAVGAGGRDLFLLNLKTLGVSRIAATPDYEVDPEFAPDGQSIVYAAGTPGDKADHLFVRSVDGETVRQLTREEMNDSSPVFAPDGATVAFIRDKTYVWGGLASNWDAVGVVCVVKTDGAGFRQLTPDDALASNPHFSADGKTVLYEDQDTLTSVAADGSAPPMSKVAFSGSEVDYAPDGQSMVFDDGKYSPSYRIFVARTDGTQRRRFAGPAGAINDGCFQPKYNPAGTKILFMLDSWPDGPTGDPMRSLWEIDLQAGTWREVADHGLFNDPLGWKPKTPTPAPVPSPAPAPAPAPTP